MNYTINEIPDEATDANSGDYMVMWQGKTKKVSILNLLKTLVKKSEVTNTVSASSDNVITSKGVSSLLTIPVGNTTITNAPPLQNNATYRFFFTSQITGSDDTTAMSISYNGTSYSVKATSNGSLKDFTAYPIATEQTRGLKKGEKSEEEKGETKVETKSETKSGTRATVTTYVYCQAYTTLEMMFDGTQFIIMGNPVVISNSDYTVYTDGSITYSNLYTSTEKKLNKKWFGSDVYCKVFSPIPLSAGDIIVTNDIESSKIIRLYGYAVVGNTYVNLCRGSDQLDLYSQSNQIVIHSSGYASFNAVVVVEYIR